MVRTHLTGSGIFVIFALRNLQFLLRSGQCNDYALVSLTQNISFSLENNRFECIIFIHLKYAFDSLDDDILLSELEQYGIRGSSHTGFKSHLQNRKQFVSVNGRSSSVCNTTRDVPQRLVLGPLPLLRYK